MQKPRIAFVSSMNEPCANAAYTEQLIKVFEPDFDITAFDIGSAAVLKRLGKEAEQAAEAHIGRICHQLRPFDVVNVQCEMGLFGATVEQCKRRLFNLCAHAPRLIYTLHSFSVRGDDFEHAHRFLFEALCKRRRNQPWVVLVHLPRDRQEVIDRFGVPPANVVHFPVMSLSMPDRQALIAGADPAAWKRRNGLQPDDIVIGRLGFITQNKDFITGLKALSILPPQYKMAFVGGQHFQTIADMTIHPPIREVVDFIDEHDDRLARMPRFDPERTPLMRDRVVFLGNTDNVTLYDAMANMDYLLVNYLETWQSGSLIASLSMELQRPSLFAYNRTFIEYEKYFPSCFEFFNMGNHHEIRHKIMHFDRTKLANIPPRLERYTIERLGTLYAALAAAMAHGNTPAEDAAVQRIAYGA
jgi:glycosyltransferase involved in cell wall biosynthesis